MGCEASATHPILNGTTMRRPRYVLTLVALWLGLCAIGRAEPKATG